MSLKMGNLLDVEKYLLLELAYFHLPPMMKNHLSREKPVKLDVYIDLIDQCHYAIYPSFVNRSPKGRKIVQLRQGYFRKIYANSENLADVMITGYMNDNYGPFGNTADRRKTSFVGLAFTDSENNGAVSFSGCELMYPSNAILDWGGCLIAGLGIVTDHHRKAMKFYDDHMQEIAGERGILGHSKGGNLATYVFINRLQETAKAYCVNAQPYCWQAMNETQKEALKTDRFEYIVHADDPTRNASYVSYISRTAPLNRYAAKHFINIHNLAEVNFDEFGNLEGTRVIRETANTIKSRLFRDFTSEKRISHDQCMERFRGKIAESTSFPRLVSTSMDEMLMVTDALAAILWLKDEDSEGDFIYPLIIKSPSADELYQLKLRPGNGIAAQCVFTGLPLFIRDSTRCKVHFEGIDHALGMSVSSEIAVPLGIDEKDVFGALELLNKKNGVFTVEDFSLVNEMTLAMLDVFRSTGLTIDSCRDFTLLKIRRGSEKLFSIEKHDYLELLFSSVVEKEALRQMICGESLGEDEVLLFNRRKFSAAMKAELNQLRLQEYAVLFADGKFRERSQSVQDVLKTFFGRSREKETQVSEAVEKAGLQELLRTPVKNLMDADYVKLEYAMAMAKHPMLLIVNPPFDGLDRSAWEALCADLKRDCLNKTVTVIVLNWAKDLR